MVCDRFTDASRAYQGAARGQGRERVDTLAAWVHGDLTPDLTVLLDAPAAVGMERAGRRGAADRLETEQLAFFERRGKPIWSSPRLSRDGSRSSMRSKPSPTCSAILRVPSTR